MELRDHQLIKKLLSLGLPPEDYAVFGSGPMFAHGIKDTNDFDIIARGKAWEKAASMGKVEPAKMEGSVVRFFGDEIEIFDVFGPGEWNQDELIDSAEIIEGIRFVTLENTIKWKRIFGRPKDFDHIKLIEEYLKKNG